MLHYNVKINENVSGEGLLASFYYFISKNKGIKSDGMWGC